MTDEDRAEALRHAETLPRDYAGLTARIDALRAQDDAITERLAALKESAAADAALRARLSDPGGAS
jgi:hypothetical protein